MFVRYGVSEGSATPTVQTVSLNSFNLDKTQLNGTQ